MPMRDHEHFLFYTTQVQQDTLILDPTETHHALHVLRLREGDPVLVTDGNGSIFECRYQCLNKQGLQAQVVDKRLVPRFKTAIHLFVGLPDREAFEIILEHVTALGVERIIPVQSQNCRKEWWHDWERHLPRFQNKLISSMKQSLYPYIPSLDNPVKFDEIADTPNSVTFLADFNGDNLLNTLNKIALRSDCQTISCIIGPPGGFTDEEVNVRKSQGAILVKIAPTRLRTELAATVLCGQIVGTIGN